MDSQTGNSGTPLRRHDGWVYLWAAEALLKGVLESEIPVDLISGVRSGALGAVFDAAGQPEASTLLASHDTSVLHVDQSARAVELGDRAARGGRRAIVLIPNDHLDQTMHWIERTATTQADRSGALLLIAEDNPRIAPHSDPRQAFLRVGLPCVELSSVEDLRSMIEGTLRMSRGCCSPIGVVVSHTVLTAGDTIEARPNRVHDSIDAVIARRRRAPSRIAETGGVLRIARRLQLNEFEKAPNPGERVPVGFITVGPAREALAHVVHVLGLTGRVPTLHLGLINPIDDAVVTRALERCEQVVVLEPRPGTVESAIVRGAEAMRRKGHRPALVWGHLLPSDPADESSTNPRLDVEDALHPSILARRIIHLLHSLRPTLQVASRLAPDPPQIEVPIVARTRRFGESAAIEFIGALLSDLDAWLQGYEPAEGETFVPSALSIEAVVQDSPSVRAADIIKPDAEAARADQDAGRIVTAEIWSQNRFLQDGVAALRQVARSERPCLFIIFNLADALEDDGLASSEPGWGTLQDFERFVRGAIPGARSDRVQTVTVNLTDSAATIETLRAAARADRLTVIVAREGSPARFSLGAMRRSLTEVDRLGFQPRQRVVWRTEETYADIGRPQRATIELSQASPIQIRSQVTVEKIGRKRSKAVGIWLTPLAEEIEVIRTRPPLFRLGSALAARGRRGELPVSTPVHGQQSHWRVHLAGIRAPGGGGAGLATEVLCQAGRIMGYHVRSVFDPTMVAAGRGAWSQVIFSRFGANQWTDDQIRDAAFATQLVSQRPGSQLLTPAIPYGEADLLLGLDVTQTLLAVSSQGTLRVASKECTTAVANSAALSDEPDEEEVTAAAGQLVPILRSVAGDDACFVSDIAGVCKRAFHTDRVADLVILGAAYQRGLIPLSLEAVESALESLEARNIGRCMEAFRFGRALAIDQSLIARGGEANAPEQESVDQALRRSVRFIGRLSSFGGGGAARASRFDYLVRGALAKMPGLAESEQGRTALRDFLRAMDHCRIWGGFEYARRFSSLILSLYNADRPDTGRALTRRAILPLAQAMVIPDPIYWARMTMGAEHRRSIRRELNVRRGRGDQIERHFLIRLDITAFGRHARIDHRTSDWPAALLALVGRVLPHRWRGNAQTRQVRERLFQFCEQASEGATGDWAGWSEAMKQLHDAAAKGRLTVDDVQRAQSIPARRSNESSEAAVVSG